MSANTITIHIEQPADADAFQQDVKALLTEAGCQVYDCYEDWSGDGLLKAKIRSLLRWINVRYLSPWSDMELRPAFFVKRDGKSFMLDVKPFTILLHPVVQAFHFSTYYRMPIIVCMPDEKYVQVPGSVRQFAIDNNVLLTDLSGLPELTEGMLNFLDMCDSGHYN